MLSERYNIIQKTAKDYYPFGSVLSGRSWSDQSLTATYKYGFNGKDKVDEISGEGNDYDFGARIYDSRLGRWMSLDPLMKKYPEFSGYLFALNNPICFIDIDGRDIIFGVGWNKSKFQLAYEKMKSQNNTEFMTMFSIFNNNSGSMNLEMRVEALSTNNGTGGTTGPAIDNSTNLPITTRTSFVTEYNPRVTQSKPFGTTDAMFELLPQEDRDIIGPIVITTEHNDISYMLFVFHEMLHATIMRDPKIEIDNTLQHNEMAKTDNRQKLVSFLTDANVSNKWDLSESEIQSLSWHGMENTKEFKEWFCKLANIPNNWEDEKDLAKKNEYIQAKDKAWNSYTELHKDLLNDKVYTSAKYGEIGRENSSKVPTFNYFKKIAAISNPTR